jgi:hypothetical protein
MLRILCAALMLCLLSGCSSNELSEKIVRREIQSRFDQEIRLDFVEVGRIGTHCQAERNGKVEDNPIDPAKSEALIVAQMGGYITITPDGADYWQVRLTDKGMNAPNADRFPHRDYQSKLNGCDFKGHTLAIAQPRFVRVVDMRHIENEWAVKFTWKWEPTEFGRSLQKGGDIYSKLSPQQIDMLPYHLAGDGMPIPIPVPADEMDATAVFTLVSDGKWMWDSKVF